MKSPSLRCFRLAALLVAGLVLAGCAGTSDNAQHAQAMPTRHADMNTPF
jgi:hypothetical protein